VSTIVLAIRVHPSPVQAWGVGVPLAVYDDTEIRATAGRDLDAAVAGWQEKYPGVPAQAWWNRSAPGSPASGPGTRCTARARAARSPSTRPHGRTGWRASRPASPSTSTSKADLVRSIGADEVIDYTRAEVDRDGQRYDVVIDTAGNRRLRLLRRAMTPHGRWSSSVGSTAAAGCSAAFDRQLRAPLASMFVGQRMRGLIAKERAEDLEEVGRLIDSGAVTPVIDRTYALADAADAIRYLAEGHAAGKVVVTI
jgi:Zinc-binding dehydrogenase